MANQYNGWTLLEEVPGNGRSHWLCRCECGTVKSVRLDHLKSGASTCCGCRHNTPQWNDGVTYLDEGQIADIVEKYVSGGMSTQQLADQYYVSKPTIGNYLKSAGVPMRGKGGNNNPTGYCGSWGKHSVAKEYSDDL